MKEDFCGSVGTETVGEWLLAIDNHPNIIGVILDIDSPGGSADGPASTNKIISNMAKPVVCLVDGMMCSAAYFLGCSADYIMAVSETSMFGSIGTQSSFTDYSQQDKANGVKRINIVSDLSPNKNLAFDLAKSGDTQPLKNEMLNPLTKIFHDSVVKGRGKKLANTTSAKAPLDGGIYIGNDAIAIGLADGIGSMEDAINKVVELSNKQKGIYKLA
jgi:protease-4